MYVFYPRLAHHRKRGERLQLLGKECVVLVGQCPLLCGDLLLCGGVVDIVQMGMVVKFTCSATMFGVLGEDYYGPVIWTMG